MSCSSANARAASFAGSKSPSTRWISAPSSSRSAGFVALACAGTKTAARTPRRRAAHAVAAPWLPVDAVTTSLPQRSSVGSAPRHLKAPSSWTSSRLRKTPSSQRSSGDVTASKLHSDGAGRVHRRRSRKAVRALAGDLSPARARLRGLALADRRHRRDSTADVLGPRLRALAGLHGREPVPEQELPLVHRVREQDRERSDDPRHARRLARRALHAGSAALDA